jgi:ankyrin repeat protein
VQGDFSFLLSLAAEAGHFETCKLLLERGAGVLTSNHVRNWGAEDRWSLIPLRQLSKALVWAASRGHVSICELLLDAGADIHSCGVVSAV